MPSAKNAPPGKPPNRPDSVPTSEQTVSATEPTGSTRPKLVPLPSENRDEPERGIGVRVRYARQELGLSVEALSRYSKNFDTAKSGISASSILRYEAGEFLPGSKELRILCDALDVPPRWLLYGELDNSGTDEREQQLLAALEAYVKHRANELQPGGIPARKLFESYPIFDRQRWLNEAKKPKA